MANQEAVELIKQAMEDYEAYKENYFYSGRPVKPLLSLPEYIYHRLELKYGISRWTVVDGKDEATGEDWRSIVQMHVGILIPEESNARLD